MPEVQPLFTAEEFFRAAHKFQALSEANMPQERTKPRASGLLDCARDIVYSMANETPSNPEADTDHRDQAFSNEDNRRTEDLTVDVIRMMGKGFVVTDRQIAVPADSLYTGHPDGAFGIEVWETVRSADLSGFESGPFAMDDPDDEQDVVTGYTKVIDGLKWGFEHKKLGRYSYLKVFKEGLLSAKPGYIVQALTYGKALGWDVVQFVILAEDASSMRSEVTQAKRSKNYTGLYDRPDWNPKVLLPVVDLRPLYALFPSIEARAQALIDARAEGVSGDDIQPEFNGTDKFPCNDYCDWRDRCRLATQVAEAKGEPLRVIPRTALNAA